MAHPSIAAPEILEYLRSTHTSSSPRKDIVLVDVRRNDHEGGTIRGSINLPAQSLGFSIPPFYDLLERSGVKTVVWYCGSCTGRGPRCAGQFGDYVKGRNGAVESLILEGGIKGWVKRGGEYTAWVDGFEAGKWEVKEGQEG